MSDCQNCDVETVCFYPFKPCDCFNQRKFWGADRRAEYDRENPPQQPLGAKDGLWERIHAMEKVLAYVGECAGVEPGDVDGLIDWADRHREQPSNAVLTRAPQAHE
jgi:hypothetical protein